MKKVILFFCLLFAVQFLNAQDGKQFANAVRNFTHMKNVGFDVPNVPANRYATVKYGETIFVTAFDKNATVLWQKQYAGTLDLSGNLLTLMQGNKTLYFWGKPKADKTKNREKPKK